MKQDLMMAAAKKRSVIEDPNWDKVVLCLPMDGADNGTTFTDVKGKIVTANGNAKTVTATKKFGTASAYFDGAGGYLTVADSDDFAFGSGDFTVEAWVYISAYQTYFTVAGQWESLSDYSWAVYITNSGSLAVASMNSSSVEKYSTSAAGVVPLGTWKHIAAVRNGSTITGYVDGVSCLTIDVTGFTLRDSTTAVSIGRILLSPAYYANGYIDDLRITKGLARYTEDFTPPVRALPTR